MSASDAEVTCDYPTMECNSPRIHFSGSVFACHTPVRATLRPTSSSRSLSNDELNSAEVPNPLLSTIERWDLLPNDEVLQYTPSHLPSRDELQALLDSACASTRRTQKSTGKQCAKLLPSANKLVCSLEGVRLLFEPTHQNPNSLDPVNTVQASSSTDGSEPPSLGPSGPSTPCEHEDWPDTDECSTLRFREVKNVGAYCRGLLFSAIDIPVSLPASLDSEHVKVVLTRKSLCITKLSDSNFVGFGEWDSDVEVRQSAHRLSIDIRLHNRWLTLQCNEAEQQRIILLLLRFHIAMSSKAIVGKTAVRQWRHKQESSTAIALSQLLDTVKASVDCGNHQNDLMAALRCITTA